MIGYEISLMREIKTRKARYFGHIIRGERIQKELMEGKVEGTRKRGRPRRTWMSDIQEWTQMTYTQCARRAVCRRDWRGVTAFHQGDVATARQQAECSHNLWTAGL